MSLVDFDVLKTLVPLEDKILSSIEMTKIILGIILRIILIVLILGIILVFS